jgi:hypothetical protein
MRDGFLGCRADGKRRPEREGHAKRESDEKAPGGTT